MVKLFLDSFWPMVLAGIKYSIPMMLISFALGLVVALFVALGRNSKIKIISGICAFYVWIIRGTPLLVQLFIIFYGLPSVGIVFTPFVSAILGLTISQGASLGMTKGQTLIHVILPQAALTAVPALANSFISLLKDTSLCSILTVQEIFMVAKQISAIQYQPLLLYIEAAIVYLIFSTILTFFQGKIEKRLGRHLVPES